MRKEYERNFAEYIWYSFSKSNILLLCEFRFYGFAQKWFLWKWGKERWKFKFSYIKYLANFLYLIIKNVWKWTEIDVNRNIDQQFWNGFFVRFLKENLLKGRYILFTFYCAYVMRKSLMLNMKYLAKHFSPFSISRGLKYGENWLSNCF